MFYTGFVTFYMSLLLKDDKNTLTSVLTNLQKEMNNSALKRSVVSLRIQLKQFTKEVAIKKKLAKAYLRLLDKIIFFLSHNFLLIISFMLSLFSKKRLLVHDKPIL